MKASCNARQRTGGGPRHHTATRGNTAPRGGNSTGETHPPTDRRAETRVDLWCRYVYICVNYYRHRALSIKSRRGERRRHSDCVVQIDLISRAVTIMFARGYLVCKYHDSSRHYRRGTRHTHTQPHSCKPLSYSHPTNVPHAYARDAHDTHFRRARGTHACVSWAHYHYQAVSPAVTCQSVKSQNLSSSNFKLQVPPK